MKYLIIIFFLLANSCVVAQQQDINTAYTELRYGLNPLTGDSVYYEKTTTVFSDGRVNSSESHPMNRTDAILLFFDRANAAGRAFSEKVNDVWKKAQVIDFILQANQVLTTVFDTSIIQISVDVFGPAVDSTAWDVISEQGTFTGNLTIAPNGNSLRMRIGATNYTLLPAGDAWIRFQGVPSGSFTDLHRKQGPGKLEFRSVDQSLIIRRQ